MPGMSDAKARLLASIEADPRSDEWIFVTLEDDGTIVNASGIFPDEVSAMVAAEQDRRNPINVENDLCQNYKTIPLFRTKGQHAE